MKNKLTAEEIKKLSSEISSECRATASMMADEELKENIGSEPRGWWHRKKLDEMKSSIEIVNYFKIVVASKSHWGINILRNVVDREYPRYSSMLAKLIK